MAKKKHIGLFVLLGVGLAIGAVYTAMGCAWSDEGCWYKNLGKKKDTAETAKSIPASI